MRTGVLRWFEPLRGRGGIILEAGQQEIFVKLSPEETMRAAEMREGQPVLFNSQRCDKMGREIATALRPSHWELQEVGLGAGA